MRVRAGWMARRDTLYTSCVTSQWRRNENTFSWTEPRDSGAGEFRTGRAKTPPKTTVGRAGSGDAQHTNRIVASCVRRYIVVVVVVVAAATAAAASLPGREYDLRRAPTKMPFHHRGEDANSPRSGSLGAMPRARFQTAAAADAAARTREPTNGRHAEGLQTPTPTPTTPPRRNSSAASPAYRMFSR